MEDQEANVPAAVVLDEPIEEVEIAANDINEVVDSEVATKVAEQLPNKPTLRPPPKLILPSLLPSVFISQFYAYSDLGKTLYSLVRAFNYRYDAVPVTNDAVAFGRFKSLVITWAASSFLCSVSLIPVKSSSVLTTDRNGLDWRDKVFGWRYIIPGIATAGFVCLERYFIDLLLSNIGFLRLKPRVPPAPDQVVIPWLALSTSLATEGIIPFIYGAIVRRRILVIPKAISFASAGLLDLLLVNLERFPELDDFCIVPLVALKTFAYRLVESWSGRYDLEGPTIDHDPLWEELREKKGFWSLTKKLLLISLDHHFWV